MPPFATRCPDMDEMLTTWPHCPRRFISCRAQQQYFENASRLWLRCSAALDDGHLDLLLPVLHILQCMTETGHCPDEDGRLCLHSLL